MKNIKRRMSDKRKIIILIITLCALSVLLWIMLFFVAKGINDKFGFIPNNQIVDLVAEKINNLEQPSTFCDEEAFNNKEAVYTKSLTVNFLINGLVGNGNSSSNPYGKMSSNVTYVHTHSWSGWKHNSECHWKYCAGCGEFKEVEYHKLVEYERVDATCTKDGYVRYKCKCGYKCRKILKAKHKFDSGKVIVSATCNQQGIKQYTCTVCKKVKKVYIAPTETHHYDNGYVTVSPTCTSTGITTYTCLDCGKKYQKVTSATGKHVYGNGYVYRKATCTEQGINAYKCKYCDHVYYKYTSKAQHYYDNGVITLAPTSTNTGIRTYTCYNCGTKKTEVIPAGCSHTCTYWSSNSECHWKRCTKCSEAYEVDWHKFDSGTITTQPTEYSTGIKTYKCSICGHNKTEVIPKLTPTSKLGSLEIVTAESNYFAGQSIAFTLRYTDVTAPTDLRIYINGYEIPNSQFYISHQITGAAIYIVDAPWTVAGKTHIEVYASNYKSASTYIDLL